VASEGDRRSDPEVAERRSRLLGRPGFQAEGARGVAIALLSTAVFVTVVLVAITQSAGWPEVHRTFFDWGDISGSFPEIARAFVLNVKIFLVCEVFILVFALLIAVLRSLPGPVFFPLRALAIIYADLARGIPTILVIALLGFGAPALELTGVPRSRVFWAGVGLILVYSGYVAEVYRAGIESVHPSQEAAARSLGLSRFQALRRVILPQAIRRVIPPLLNDFIGLQKDTALVGTLGVIEAFNQSQIDTNATFTYGSYLAALRGDHDPARPAHRLADRPRPAPPPGRRRVRMSALRLEGVRKSFGSHEVLRGIDLELEDHEVVCLIGASGSGKSTLLRCVNLLEPLDAGRIALAGEEITRRGVDVNAVRRRIGIVFQAFNLFPHMTVLRNVTLAPRDVLGLKRAEAEARALELLARFGLEGRRDEYPDRLSGGQQQRVAIVRALAMRPELMLLDEVTSALDPELVAEVLSVIRELAEGGMTMLIATHEMSFARDIASRVCFLDDGSILEEGLPHEIFAHPRQPRTQQFLERIIEAGRL
jgi:polar amino acid transport system ATP-binding protein